MKQKIFGILLVVFGVVVSSVAAGLDSGLTVYLFAAGLLMFWGGAWVYYKGEIKVEEVEFFTSIGVNANKLLSSTPSVFSTVEAELSNYYTYYDFELDHIRVIQIYLQRDSIKEKRRILADQKVHFNELEYIEFSKKIFNEIHIRFNQKAVKKLRYNPSENAVSFVKGLPSSRKEIQYLREIASKNQIEIIKTSRSGQNIAFFLGIMGLIITLLIRMFIIKG